MCGKGPTERYGCSPIIRQGGFCGSRRRRNEGASSSSRHCEERERRSNPALRPHGLLSPSLPFGNDGGKSRPFGKNQKRTDSDKQKTQRGIPPQRLLEIQDREAGEHHQRD